jgi:hypothetical protein
LAYYPTWFGGEIEVWIFYVQFSVASRGDQEKSVLGNKAGYIKDRVSPNIATVLEVMSHDGSDLLLGDLGVFVKICWIAIAALWRFANVGSCS